MITLLLRALAGLVGFVLLLVLVVGGIGVAVFCIEGGEGSLSPAHLASLLSLGDLRDTVGPWLSQLEADGPSAVVAALSGAGAIVLGLALLCGAIVPRRERLLRIESGDQGVLSARRRATAKAIAAVAGRPRDVISAKVRVRPYRRRDGGRACLTLTRPRSRDESETAQRARTELEALAERLSLRLRIRNRSPRRGGRVL